MAEAGATDAQEKAAMADAARMAEHFEDSFDPAEMYIYQYMGFYIAELKVTGELLEGLSSGENAVFSEEQTQRLRDKLRQHADIPPPCTEVNKLLVDFAVQLDFKSVDRFLLCLEKHQKEIPQTILGGVTLKDISSGNLGSSDVSEEARIEEEREAVAKMCKAKLAKYGIPMKPLDDYLEELTKTKTDDYYIGPKGGEFDFASTDGCGCDHVYNTHLSVPKNAVPRGLVRCKVFASRDKGKVISESPYTFLSPAFFFEGHGLRFQKPVTVTIKLPRNSVQCCKEVRLFSSDTTDNEEPDFKDVTSECNPSLSITKDSALVKFQLSHFSIYAVLFGVALGAASVKILETKIVHLEVAAPAALRNHRENIPLRVCVVKDSTPGREACARLDYQLVKLESHAIQLPFFSCITVEVCEPDNGDYWKAESLSHQKIQCDEVTETVLTWSGHSSPPRVGGRGRSVVAKGAFKCTVTSWNVQHCTIASSTLVHFTIAEEVDAGHTDAQYENSGAPVTLPIPVTEIERQEDAQYENSGAPEEVDAGHTDCTEGQEDAQYENSRATVTLPIPVTETPGSPQHPSSPVESQPFK